MFGSIELDRNGLVAKILTWGTHQYDCEKYFSKTQNVCPMFWRFIFKMVCIAVYYPLIAFSVLWGIAMIYTVVMHLAALTFGGAVQSIAYFMVGTIAILGAVLVAGWVGYKIFCTCVSFLRQQRKESKGDVAKLVTSYREARRGKFCSPVTFS